MSCTYGDMPDCVYRCGVACKGHPEKCERCGFNPDVKAYRIAKLKADWKREAERGKEQKNK